MRTNDILLDGFNDIRTLQRYLYMSDEHYIEIENVIGVKLRIRMGENLHYYCKNMNFPDLPDACFSESMTNKTIMNGKTHVQVLCCEKPTEENVKKAIDRFIKGKEEGRTYS